LETDDLIYRWEDGTEKRRVPFSWDGVPQSVIPQELPELILSQDRKVTLV